MGATPASDAGLGRALEFQRRTIELVADELEEIDEGWVVRSRALPLMWSLNHVRLRAPVSFAEALELSERHFARTSFRHVVIEDESTGEELAETFRRQGWEVDVEVHMGLAGGPAAHAGTTRVSEAGEEEALELMRLWTLEDPPKVLTGDGLRQIIDYQRLTWRSRQASRFGVHGPAGALQGITMLFSDGPIAQVEDVYVVPEARGRGFGKTLVTHVAGLAREQGHEFTFIVADDNDWPKHLYTRAGFKSLGRTWLFHRDV